MKRLFHLLSTAGFLLVTALRLSASEAIPFYGLTPPTSTSNVFSVNIVGYANGGAGFAFSPLTDISVYSLGFNNSSLTTNDFQVTLFDSGWSPLASATLNSSDSFLNVTYYEDITPLTLHSGNTYYLSAVHATFGVWFGDVILASGLDANGIFSVAPEISWLGYTTGTTVHNDAQAYLVGPNFQFSVSVVPEPSTFALSGLGAAGLFLLRRRTKDFIP